MADHKHANGTTIHSAPHAPHGPRGAAKAKAQPHTFRPHDVAFVLEKPQVKPALFWILQVKEFLHAHSKEAKTTDQEKLLLSNALETVCLQYAVKLAPNLVHYHHPTRARAVYLFCVLADIFRERESQSSSQSSKHARVASTMHTVVSDICAIDGKYICLYNIVLLCGV